MKIAIPTRENVVDDHFGHCEFYTVFTVNEKKEVVEKVVIPSPQGCGCKSDIASIFEKDGVTVMLAGNMGGGALNVLTSHNIKVVRGCSGNVETVLKDYLADNLADSGIGCSSHDHSHGDTHSSEGHSCSHQ